MRMQLTAFILAAVAIAAAQNVTTGALGNATVVTQNPAGAVYTATLPDTAFDTDAFPSGGNVKGSIYAVSSPDGVGVLFQVKFSGLPGEGGPFLYHIHDQPVPADGNCTDTLAHLDPFERGETPDCDSTAQETCQVGDLSGKHGKISSDPFSATYTDDYASLESGIGAFFGNRSFVLHFANKTRITCANFTAVNTGSSGSCAGSSSTKTAAASATTGANIAPGANSASGSVTASNATATVSAPTASATFVAAGGNANVPTLLLAIGSAALAYVL